MFSGANNALVSGGTFTIHAPTTNIHWINHERGAELLRDNVASSAFHDSAERYDPPKCHPGTREVIIKEIMDWIESVGKEEFFLWLYGPAGAGKSAIAQSIAELCCKAGLLAASFFFSRSAASRNDATLLIPTLAYQLTVSIPETVKHISAAVEKDTLIFTRSLEAQLEALIIKPLSKLTPDQDVESGGEPKARPRFIIIDGLDECGQPKTQHYILTTLSSAVRQSRIPLFFLIASRPEQQIRDVFNEKTTTPLTRRLVLDDNYKPDADIKIFLASKFAKIKECHPLACVIPPSWPSYSDLDKLIGKASGQFIYASTVIKFVESPRHHPIDRLDIVFGLKPPGKQTPFAELDALYTLIFMSVDDIEAVLDIFMFLLLFDDAGYKEKPSVVEAFWGYRPGYLQIILADLHSVIFVPSTQSEENKLRLFHASLGDFLTDKSRSGEFFVNTPQAHARMAECCIKHTSTFMSLGKMDEVDSYLRVSCKILMDECVKAHPTKKLLQTLGSFRFDMFLALPSTNTRGDHEGWRHTMLDLSKFLDWIQPQCAQTHDQGCLCRSYVAHIDHNLRVRVSKYQTSDPCCQYLFTAFTMSHSSCSFNTGDFLDIIDRDKHLRDMDHHRMDLIGVMGLSDGHPNSRSMLTAFFTDPIRSGIYYRDKSKYIDLALKCLDYLCIPSTHPKRPDTDECASKITLDILSRFPREHQLANFLRLHRVGRKRYRRSETVLAIQMYIKDYDLSTINAPSGQDLSETSRTSSTSDAMKQQNSQSELPRSKNLLNRMFFSKKWNKI